VPGSPSDGLNYLKFLKSVKGKMPSGKTVSIALPASYWYLKGFPVKLMSAVVDYFIYMTYDLHGQWDYGSKWSNPSCKTGNCLRSHVNKTETQTALSMVTKAGVPSNKIMVGVSSYGRSFKMLDSFCTGVMCKFTGSPKVSNAEPGMCTATSGYIADAEIQALIEADGEDGSVGVKKWFDDASDSNIMVSPSIRALHVNNADLVQTWKGNWVAYMDGFTKYTRIEWVKELNFGGTTDWAVDLQEFRDPLDDGDGEDDSDIDNAEDEDCIQEYANLDALVADINNVASVCAAEYAIGTMATLLDETLTKYDEIKNDYDGKFGYYAGYIDELVNPQLEVRICLVFLTSTSCPITRLHSSRFSSNK
jgi:chitinase